MNKNIVHLTFGLFLLLSAFLTSCERFENKAEIPAFVKIDSVQCFTNESNEGTNNQKITDVWFNLEGSQVGVFEIPTHFPVIANSRKPVSLRAGIVKSGIHDYREPYPFFKTIRDTLDFVGTKTIILNPVFEYKEETKFWIENFEDPGLKFHTNDSTNLLTQSIDPENASNHIGYIHLPDTISAFQIYTSINIQLAYTPIYMEIEYKNDEAFGVGILMQKQGGGYETLSPFTIVKSSENWNKLYLNLSEQMAANPGALSYDVYFFFASNNGEEANIFLDNIKILYF